MRSARPTVENRCGHQQRNGARGLSGTVEGAHVTMPITDGQFVSGHLRSSAQIIYSRA